MNRRESPVGGGPKFIGRTFPLLFWLLAILALFTAFAGWPALISRIACPFQILQTEAEIVQRSQDFLQGRPFFVDFRKSIPILYAPCSVFFYALLIPLMKLTGGLWQPGRMIAFTFYMGTALLLGVWGFRRWQKTWALASIAFFLLSPTWALWGTVARTDSLMIFLNLCCLLLAEKGMEASEPKKGSPLGTPVLLLAAAGLFNTLAIFCKFTAGTTTLAVASALVLERRWGLLKPFLAFSMGISIFVVGILEYSTGGLFLLGGNGLATGYDWGALWYFISRFFFPEAGWLVAALVVAFGFGRMPLLWKCQTAFSLIWLFSMGRGTAAENYYLEFIPIGLLAVGEAFRSQGFRKAGMEEAWKETVLFLCFVIGFFQMTRLTWPGTPSLEEQNIKTQAVQIYRLPGEHLAMDEDLLLMAGKRNWLQVHGFKELVEGSHLDPTPLIAAIQNRFFASIELYDLPKQPFLPESVETEIRKDYSVGIRKWGRVWLFPRLLHLPKPEENTSAFPSSPTKPVSTP